MTDDPTPTILRNRLVLATAMWREATEDPLPKMEPGDPMAQIEAFELKVVDLLCSEADAVTARATAEKTWDLVHDRPDDDPVKKRVVECHERLAELGRPGESEGGAPAAEDSTPAPEEPPQ